MPRKAPLLGSEIWVGYAAEAQKMIPKVWQLGMLRSFARELRFWTIRQYRFLSFLMPQSSEHSFPWGSPSTQRTNSLKGHTIAFYPSLTIHLPRKSNLRAQKKLEVQHHTQHPNCSRPQASRAYPSPLKVVLLLVKLPTQPTLPCEQGSWASTIWPFLEFHSLCDSQVSVYY